MVLYLFVTLVVAGAISVALDCVGPMAPAPRRLIVLGALLWPILLIGLLEVGLVAVASKALRAADAQRFAVAPGRI